MTETRQRYDIDQVRERTDLLALISQYVTLRQRGNRHVGLCPFHQEKTPSFGVDPQKGFWHCFGCGTGGDAFTFLMQIEKLTFMEAVERLADRAGIRPVETAAASYRKEERDYLFNVNAEAAAAYATALRGKAGPEARNYLAQRGITPEQARRFSLGYAPRGGQALVAHLPKHGFSVEIMAKSGLALARGNGEGYFDRFRHRLMIPIYDRQGRVVAFGGRALEKAEQPKYLNTAETPIFHKSHMFYALNWAEEAIRTKNRVIITEGYFDVIACHLAGFTEAVATLGTALGEEHVRILRRYAQVVQTKDSPAQQYTRILLVFDGDSAGVNASLRSQALFRQADMDVRIVCLPGGHDPDTFLREFGAEAFERYLADALSPVEFELARLVQQHPAVDAESRLRLFRAAARILQPLSKLERAEYALRLIDRALGARGDLSELQQAVLGEVAALDRAPRGVAPMRPAASPPMAVAPVEREVLTAIIQHPDFAVTACTLIPAEAFSDPRYRDIFEFIDNIISTGNPFDVSQIVFEDENITSLVADLALREMIPLAPEKYPTLIDRLLEEYANRLIKPEAILFEREVVDLFTLQNQQRSAREKQRNYDDETNAGFAPEDATPIPDVIKNRARGVKP
jgi:DNA primase